MNAIPFIYLILMELFDHYFVSKSYYMMFREICNIIQNGRRIAEKVHYQRVLRFHFFVFS